MFRALGIVAGIVSLTLLAWKGFHFSFGPFLLALLDELERDYAYFFGFVEPYLKEALSYLNAVFGWDLRLQPHWKHAFTLMWLFVSNGARTTWAIGLRGGAVFHLMWGFLVALLSGVLFGTAALSGAASNAVMAFWPMAGVVLFQMGLSAWTTTFHRREGYTWLGMFRAMTWFSLTTIALPGAVVIAVGMLASEKLLTWGLPSPVLAVLVSMYLALALRMLWLGASDPKGSGETRWQRFLNDGLTRVAVSMLSVIGGATVVVLLGMAGV